jgi:hypothetical protein
MLTRRVDSLYDGVITAPRADQVIAVSRWVLRNGFNFITLSSGLSAVPAVLAGLGSKYHV